MPDAVTHLLTARLVATLERRAGMRAVLYLGVLWPDILAKGVGMVLRSPAGFDIPSHSVIGLIVASAAAALLFRAPDRGVVFGLLMAGSLLHLAADLLKDFGVFPGLRLFFPIFNKGFSAGLFRGEQSAIILPLSLLLILAFELAARRRRGRDAQRT